MKSPAFMQLIHAGYTPEDAIFHAEMDLHADRVTDDPKPSKTASQAKTSGSQLPTSNTPITDRPRKMKPRKPRRPKKWGTG